MRRISFRHVTPLTRVAPFSQFKIYLTVSSGPLLNFLHFRKIRFPCRPRFQDTVPVRGP